MDRISQPRFNSDLPATPAYRIDIEDETIRREGVCSRCQKSGAGDDDDRSTRGTDPRQSLCPCCQRRQGQNAANSTTRGDHGNGHALKIGVNPDSEGPYGCQEGTKYEEALHLQETQAQAAYGRKWEYFQGKNHFYCDGRIMTAPTIRYCVLSFGLILVTFGLFIWMDGPFLAERVTVAIPIIGSVLFLLVVVNMLRTSCSDPGILPRASQQEHEFIERTYGGNSTTIRPPPRTKDIIVNGQTVKSKYCFTCKMFRPPRASHCGVCDNCVERFDHHCPFLSNCIGKRNYRSFYIFIISLSLLAVFVLSCSITHLAMLSKDKGNFLEALRESPTSAVVVLISFFGMWTVIGLAGFHTYLIAMEQTTNEDIKGLFGRGNTKNPYSRGNFCLNCCFILCGPHHPSLINPRGTANSDFLASLPKKNSTAPTTSSAGTATPFIYPPASARAQFGGDSSSKPYPVQQTTTLEPAGNQVQSTSSMPVGVGTPVSLSSPRYNEPVPISGNAQKAGTLPETRVIGSIIGDGKAYSASQRNIPIETIPTIIHQPGGSASASKSQSLMNGGTRTNGSPTSSVSLSMVQLDFTNNHTDSISNYSNSFPPLPRSHVNNGEISVNMNGKTEGGTKMLENSTMINSPLHLDTIM